MVSCQDDELSSQMPEHCSSEQDLAQLQTVPRASPPTNSLPTNVASAIDASDVHGEQPANQGQTVKRRRSSPSGTVEDVGEVSTPKVAVASSQEPRNATGTLNKRRKVYPTGTYPLESLFEPTGQAQSAPTPAPIVTPSISSTQNPKTTSTFRFLEALCKTDNDLTLHLTTQYLPPKSLIGLYAISKDFHFLVNSHLTTYIKRSARRWASLITGQPPGGTRETWLSDLDPRTKARIEPTDDILFKVFPYPCYEELCLRDPTRAQLASATANPLPFNPLQPFRTRLCPSLRYLQFLEFRVRTIHDMIRAFAENHQFRLPMEMPATLGKLWLLMETPTNGARIAIAHSREYFADADLTRATLFFMKLDMAFIDPVRIEGRRVKPAIRFRKMLMAQRGLRVASEVLSRKDARDHYEVVRLWARWRYKPRPDEMARGVTVCGVPVEECGQMRTEGWGDLWRRVGFSWRQIPGQPGVAAQGPGQTLGNQDVAAGGQEHAGGLPGGVTAGAGAVQAPGIAAGIYQGSVSAQPGSSNMASPPPPGMTAQVTASAPPLASSMEAPAAPNTTAAAATPPSHHLQPQQTNSANPHHPATTQAFPANVTLGGLPATHPHTPAARAISGRAPLLGADAIVMREGIRRRLGLERMTRRFLVSGYYNEDTLEPYLRNPGGVVE